jgi:hypothetical protein
MTLLKYHNVSEPKLQFDGGIVRPAEVKAREIEKAAEERSEKL